MLLGAFAGLLYAILNNAMDYWHNRGIVARAFVALHDIVDDVIPIVVGALLGVAVSYVRLRSQLAREERTKAESLRARLEHVERHQAVWVVAAATLHELKNPLHSMGLLVDELEASAPSDTESLRELSTRIKEQMDRTLVPLAALRELARAEKRPATDEPIAQVAEQVVRELVVVSRSSGIELSLEGELPASARADASWVRIILENLIGNSLEGIRDGGRGRRIAVRLEHRGDKNAVLVSDDGPGLAPEMGEALFRPLETSKDSGLGLGLPIARALARAMEGDLSCASRPGWSTTFELTLPVTSS